MPRSDLAERALSNDLGAAELAPLDEPRVVAEQGADALSGLRKRGEQGSEMMRESMDRQMDGRPLLCNRAASGGGERVKR